MFKQVNKVFGIVLLVQVWVGECKVMVSRHPKSVKNNPENQGKMSFWSPDIQCFLHMYDDINASINEDMNVTSIEYHKKPFTNLNSIKQELQSGSSLIYFSNFLFQKNE